MWNGLKWKRSHFPLGGSGKSVFCLLQVIHSPSFVALFHIEREQQLTKLFTSYNKSVQHSLACFFQFKDSHDHTRPVLQTNKDQVTGVWEDGSVGQCLLSDCISFPVAQLYFIFLQVMRLFSYLKFSVCVCMCMHTCACTCVYNMCMCVHSCMHILQAHYADVEVKG